MSRAIERKWVFRKVKVVVVCIIKGEIEGRKIGSNKGYKGLY